MILRSHTLSILSYAAFSCTICISLTIAQSRTLYILSVCLTSWIKQWIQSAQLCGCMYFVLITTTTSSWALQFSIQCGILLRLLGRVNVICLVKICYCNSSIRFSGVQLRYNTRIDKTHAWKVLLRLFSSLSVYWTQTLWYPDMISWLILVYSHSSPRCPTKVGLWND